MNRLAAVLIWTFVALAGCSEQITLPDETVYSYEYTFTGDIQSPPIVAEMSSQDPFGSVAIANSTLQFPSGRLAGMCDPAFNLATDWGSYPGFDFTGTLEINGPTETPQFGGHVSLFTSASPDMVFLNLDVHVGDTPASKTIGDPTSTLTFTDAEAFVGMGSHPPGGAVDPNDRCVTFTITAVQQ